MPESRPATAFGGVTLARLAQHGDAGLDAIVGDFLAPMAGGGLPGLRGFQFGIGEVQAIDEKYQIGPAANAFVAVGKLPLEGRLGDNAQEVLPEQVGRVGIRPGARRFVPQYKGLPGKAQALAQDKSGVRLGLDFRQQHLGQIGMQKGHVGFKTLHRPGKSGGIERATLAQEVE